MGKRNEVAGFDVPGRLVEIQAIAPCPAFVTRIVQARVAEINIGTFSLPLSVPPSPFSPASRCTP